MHLIAIPHKYTCCILVLHVIFFQVVLILSGNLSFLNWLTILPSIMCFDDKILACCFSVSSHARKQVFKLQKLCRDGHSPKPSRGKTQCRVYSNYTGASLNYSFFLTKLDNKLDDELCCFFNTRCWKVLLF